MTQISQVFSTLVTHQSHSAISQVFLSSKLPTVGLRLWILVPPDLHGGWCRGWTVHPNSPGDERQRSDGKPKVMCTQNLIAEPEPQFSKLSQLFMKGTEVEGGNWGPAAQSRILHLGSLAFGKSKGIPRHHPTEPGFNCQALRTILTSLLSNFIDLFSR